MNGRKVRAMAALAAWLLGPPATAHSWYPAWCCSDHDCRELMDAIGETVAETADGWRLWDGRVVSRGVLEWSTEAAAVFTRLIAHDPLIEAGHRGLMRCYAALGERGRALHQYEELTRLLGDRLGATPAPETAQLHARLRAG